MCFVVCVEDAAFCGREGDILLLGFGGCDWEVGDGGRDAEGVV